MHPNIGGGVDIVILGSRSHRRIAASPGSCHNLSDTPGHGNAMICQNLQDLSHELQLPLLALQAAYDGHMTGKRRQAKIRNRAGT